MNPLSPPVPVVERAKLFSDFSVYKTAEYVSIKEKIQSFEAIFQPRSQVLPDREKAVVKQPARGSLASVETVIWSRERAKDDLRRKNSSDTVGTAVVEEEKINENKEDISKVTNEVTATEQDKTDLKNIASSNLLVDSISEESIQIKSSNLLVDSISEESNQIVPVATTEISSPSKLEVLVDQVTQQMEILRNSRKIDTENVSSPVSRKLSAKQNKLLTPQAPKYAPPLPPGSSLSTSTVFDSVPENNLRVSIDASVESNPSILRNVSDFSMVSLAESALSKTDDAKSSMKNVNQDHSSSVITSSNSKAINLINSLRSPINVKKSFVPSTYALKDFPYRFVFVLFCYVFDRGKSWCRKATFDIKASGDIHFESPVNFDREAKLQQLKALKSIQQQVQQETSLFNRYKEALSGENIVLSRLIDSAALLQTSWNTIMEQSAAKECRNSRSLSRYVAADSVRPRTPLSQRRTQTGPRHSLFLNLPAKEKINSKNAWPASIAKLPNVFIAQLHLASCNLYYNQERNHTLLAISDLYDSPEHKYLLQQQLQAQQNFPREATDAFAAPTPFRNMAACFVAPDVERPPPKTAEKVSDTNAMVPSFQIDELDDYKHDEILPSRHSCPLFSKLEFLVPKVERCYFRILKINKFYKNTPRLLELDIISGTLAICKKRIPEFDSSEELNSYPCREIVITRDTFVSTDIGNDNNSGCNLVITYLASAVLSAGNVAGSKRLYVKFETPEENCRFLRLFEAYVLKTNWDPKPANKGNSMSSRHASKSRSSVESLSISNTKISNGNMGCFPNSADSSLNILQIYKPRPILVHQSRVTLMSHLRQLQKELPVAVIAQDVHQNWVDARLIDGWKYGNIYDENLKLHPLLTSYSNLNNDARRKIKALVLFTIEAIVGLGFTIEKRHTKNVNKHAYNDFESLLVSANDRRSKPDYFSSSFTFMPTSSQPSLLYLLSDEYNSNQNIKFDANNDYNVMSPYSSISKTFFTAVIPSKLTVATAAPEPLSEPVVQPRCCLSVLSKHFDTSHDLSLALSCELMLMIDVLSENYHDCWCQLYMDSQGMELGRGSFDHLLLQYDNLDDSERNFTRVSVVHLLEVLVGLGYCIHLACDPTGKHCITYRSELHPDMAAPALSLIADFNKHTMRSNSNVSNETTTSESKFSLKSFFGF